MSQEQPNDTEPHDPTPFHSMTSYTTLVPSKRRKQNSASEDEKAPDGVAEDVTSMILSVWKHSNTSDTDDSIDVETAISATTAIFNEKIQGIIRMGLDAFYRAESLSTKCAFLQEEVQQKTNENERLRAAEEKNKASLSNLVIALDQSRTKTVDSANSILVEARLRAEVSTMMTQRDEAIGHAEENKHKVTLLQEQLHNQKIKLSRVTQEKIKMERDFMASQRASKSLVRSLESQSSSLNDNEYYNRKITELHGRVQSMQVVVTEKNRQIDDMRHKLDRWTSMGADNRNERKRLL